jgi:hypothetical protein
MFGFGISEIIIVASIIFIAGLARRGGGIRITGPTLVLRKFKVDEASPDDVFVEIAGRASGLTEWLLTALGFDAETSIKVTDREFSFKSSSLFGQINQVAPLPNIASTHCGYSKPIGYLMVGAVIFLGSILMGMRSDSGPGVFMFGLIIGGILLIAYWLSKKMTMSIETTGGMIMGLTFKRSVIENVSVDIEKAMQAIGIINKKVMESQFHQ